MSHSLSVSLVVYFPDEHLLQQTLSSLSQAVAKAKQVGLINEVFLIVVDNTERLSDAQSIEEAALRQFVASHWMQQPHVVMFLPKNVGYGAGHNIAIRARCDDFHLVINPDVFIHVDALVNCISTVSIYPEIGLVTPRCYHPNGQQAYLCKAYPTVWILFLRGFAPTWLKSCFQKQLAAYELRTLSDTLRLDISIASGCFMFFKRQALLDVQGFCETFFLYFEDFDLSIRIAKKWQIAYVPSVEIVHYGGHSAKKGGRHVFLFIRSARLFFKRHGWRLW